MSAPLPDQPERDRALDPGRSFIVQAPAGSGKTELLALRFLKLLALCREPEEVLAITFTRKAASEMRHRIVNTLVRESGRDADAGAPKDPLEALRRRAAGAVLARDAARGWELPRNPGRLRIQTIDSFCQYLANRLPVLSRVGGGLNVGGDAGDDVSGSFADAIAETLGELGSGSALDGDVERLLRRLDNDFERAEKLLADLLARRDQWLPHVMKADGVEARRRLEDCVGELVGDALEEARRLARPRGAALVPLCNYAARNRPDGTAAWPDDLDALPAARPAALPRWRFLAELLLTGEGRPRRRVDRRQGFPAGGAGEQKALRRRRKEEMVELIGSLAGDAALIESLRAIRRLPPPGLPDGQWRFLGSLLRVLRRLSAQLLIAFRTRRVIDHTQAAIAARDALGALQEPTETALLLDYRIRHILVDEFQDTSQLQLDILTLLTQGWQADDGRTLFLVGDAMQSCYAFRNANVGIYLSVRDRGLPEVKPEPLTLSSNFRSQAGIVEWVDAVFAPSFPAKPDSSLGAVPYSRSRAVLPAGEAPAVAAALVLHDPHRSDAAERAEAELVVERIRHVRERDPGAGIAVLVRSRDHLRAITPRLRREGIEWRSTDIDRLAALPVIDDLLSLSRAVLNPGDELAWLALLRAPWCGLDVADLHAVADAARGVGIPAALLREEGVGALSEEGRRRLAGLRPVVGFLTATRFRGTLRRAVEACWTLLHGADCCEGEVERDSADVFFGLLERHERGGGIADFYRFEDIVRDTFVPSRGADPGVQLLTMHKAKGLEFDHVLLPGLARSPRPDAGSLLLWDERLNRRGEPRLLMAAPGAAGEGDDPLYALLRHERDVRQRLEETRLLYIAVTRARRSARLYATLRRGGSDIEAPPRRSLLGRIWPVLEARGGLELLPLERLPEGGGEDAPPAAPTLIRRFAGALTLTDAQARAIDGQPPASGAPPASAGGRRGPPRRYATVHAIEGVLIHRCLEAYVRSGDQSRFFDRIEGLRAMWRLEIGRECVDAGEAERSIRFVEESVRGTVGDPELAWLFDPALEDSQCELDMTRTDGSGLERRVIDRTFIDRRGARWIIDYKTARPPRSGGREGFVKAQRLLHREQLARYRSLFDEAEVRTAILLTALPRLVEVDPAPYSSAGSTA